MLLFSWLLIVRLIRLTWPPSTHSYAHIVKFKNFIIYVCAVQYCPAQRYLVFFFSKTVIDTKLREIVTFKNLLVWNLCKASSWWNGFVSPAHQWRRRVQGQTGWPAMSLRSALLLIRENMTKNMLDFFLTTFSVLKFICMVNRRKNV